MIVSCHFCGEAIRTEARTTYRHIEGWEQPRSAGGANQITLRKQKDEYACDDCIASIKAGRHPAQAELFQ